MLKRYLSFVEIQTKITSLFAFAMSLAYLLYLNQPLDWIKNRNLFCIHVPLRPDDHRDQQLYRYPHQ